MTDVLELRIEHGNVFASKLPDGLTVPWKPLSVQEYIEYDKLFSISEHPFAYLEDEIFRKCVLDQVLVQQMDKLKAGVVSTVVQGILAYSGPHSVEDLNVALNLARYETQGALHQIVQMICQGFPAYTPEQVYEMDFYTMMLRSAQAEAKLLSTGMIAEPLEIVSSQMEQQQAAKPQPVNLKDQYDRQRQVENVAPLKPPIAGDKPVRKMTPPPEAPSLQDPLGIRQNQVITKSDIMEHAQADGIENVEAEVKARETASTVFADYMEQMKDGGKIRIKTPEERLAEAKKREEQHKKDNLERRKKLIADMAEERKELLKVREKERERRRRKANRRR